MNRSHHPTARRILFSEPDAHVYAVLDGSAIKHLPRLLQAAALEHCCLYRGELPDDLMRMAPWLVRLERDHPLTGHLLGTGWGKNWGVFASSFSDFREMRKHFRSFLTVHGPDGKPLYFRFYDPRVLRNYLPTCTAQEVDLLLGPGISYFCEAETEMTLLRFRRGPAGVKADVLTVSPDRPYTGVTSVDMPSYIG